MHMESCTPPGSRKKGLFSEDRTSAWREEWTRCVRDEWWSRVSHFAACMHRYRRGEEIDTTCRLIPIVFLRRPMSPQSFISRWRGDATWLRLQFNSLQLHLQHTTLYRSDFYALVVLAFPIPRQKLRSTSSYHILSAGVCIAS
jgi:hypothetical protein